MEDVGLPRDSAVSVKVQKLAFSLLMRHQGQMSHFVRTLNSCQVLVRPSDSDAYHLAIMAVDEVRRLYKWITLPSYLES